MGHRGLRAPGRGLAQVLAERGERVHEVAPKWSAQRRRTRRKPGKSDRLDAHAVARLVREEADALPLVLPEEPAAASVELRSRLREDVVAGMTRLRNRLHALLLLCDPESHRHLPKLTTRAGLRARQEDTAPGAGPLARARRPARPRAASPRDGRRPRRSAGGGRPPRRQAPPGIPKGPQAVPNARRTPGERQ